MVNNLFKDKVKSKIGPCRELPDINKGIDKYISDLELDDSSTNAEKIVDREFSSFSLMDPSLVKSYFLHYFIISELNKIHKEIVNKAELRAINEENKLSVECYEDYHIRCQNCLVDLANDELMVDLFELYINEIYSCLKYATGVIDEIPNIILKRVRLNSMGGNNKDEKML